MQNKQIIPDGWMVRTVKQFGKVVTGNTPPMSDKENYGNDYCWVTAQDFRGKYIYDTQVKLSEKGKLLSRPVPAGTVLVTCIASIGLNAIAKKALSTNQQINSVIVNDDNSSEFFYYLISYNSDVLKKYAGSGGMLILSKSGFEKLKFIVPPLEEQEKIAQILATWDSAIEQLTDLIAEKKQQKKALMQRLLTGKQRLPGFTKPWIEAELSDIITYEQPTKYLVTEVCKDGTDAVPVLTANKSFIVGYTKDKHGIYNKGICIIFDDFTTEVQYVNFAFKVKSSAIKILVKRSEQINLKFVYEQIKRIKRHIGGHKRYYLSEFQYNTIFLPELSEQKAITDVLMAADTEIDLLQQQLQAITEQKQGLMQQLLTGNIRVKIDKKS